MPAATDRPAAGQHTVAIAFVRSAVQALAPPVRQRVLRGCGIAPEWLEAPLARVPAAAFAQLWMDVARELDDEFFGLDRRRMKVGSFALLCHAVAGQPTLGQALRQLAQGYQLLLDDVQVQLQQEGGQARLALVNRIADPEARRFADETLLVMLHGQMCWLAGRRLRLARMALGQGRPAHAEEYRRMFATDLVFDAPQSAIVFDAELLKLRTSVTPSGLRQFLRHAPQSVFLKQVDAAGWSERVRRRLRAGPGWPTLETMAAQLGLSPATLRRRLDEEGSGWQQIKDELRRDLAIHALSQGRSGIGELALQLGFADTSAFHRAFRAWTGSAPGAYRRAAASAPQPSAGSAAQ
jgi:AraC-like DNA-binding protein